MAEGLNRVLLLGNLGADPELKMTQAGQSVLNLRLATSETYLDRDKVRRERTEWHSVAIWGKRAEALAKILDKGSRVFIEGSLRTSAYEDREGTKRYKTEVVASNVILAGGDRGTGRGDSGDARGGAGARGNGAPAEPLPDDFGYGGSDDDIPF
ncbi:MAG: single-stranded DNA-binding protein [Polyangiaceae bacterium]|nr:single-stranded DNA-binding protein [Polyangiaceae bacterium]